MTAVNIILSDMTPKMYKSCLDAYYNDPLILTILKRQFDELENVLLSIPNVYTEIEDKRTYARLRSLEKSDPTNPSIPELKKALEGKPVEIADFLMIDKVRKPISDVSKSIIIKLKNSLNTIRNRKKFIQINYTVDKEETFFGYNLYHLRSVTEGSLIYSVGRFLSRYEDRGSVGQEFWNEASRFVQAVLEHSDNSEENVYNLSEPIVEEVKEFLDNFNEVTLNASLGIEATLEDYYKAALELHDIGLIGFTPFIKEVFDEFLNNYNPSYSSEFKIRTNSPIYHFAKELGRAISSNLKLGDSLVNEEDDELEIEI